MDREVVSGFEKDGVKLACMAQGSLLHPATAGARPSPSLHTSPGATVAGLLLQAVQHLLYLWRQVALVHSSQSGPLGTPFWTDVLCQAPKRQDQTAP